MRRTLAIAFVTLLAACWGNDGIVVPNAPALPAAPRDTTPAGLNLAFSSVRSPIYPLERRQIELNVTEANGAPYAGNLSATWTSSNPSVMSVSAVGVRTGELTANAPGTARITASFSGNSMTMLFTVLPAPSIDGSSVEVESFTMVEFQYPSAAGRWYYAPQLRVRVRGGAKVAAITRLAFTIPGFGPAPACYAQILLEGDKSLDLFREIYGDYQLTFDNGGSRASGSNAVALLTIDDGNGKQHQLTVGGPIVSGALPTTYTGGNPAWICQFGPP